MLLYFFSKKNTESVVIIHKAYLNILVILQIEKKQKKVYNYVTNVFYTLGGDHDEKSN